MPVAAVTRLLLRECQCEGLCAGCGEAVEGGGISRGADVEDARSLLRDSTVSRGVRTSIDRYNVRKREYRVGGGACARLRVTVKSSGRCWDAAAAVYRCVWEQQGVATA